MDFTVWYRAFVKYRISHESTSRHRIYVGDSRLMDAVHDAGVHLVVTSPPYWQLKDYEHPMQIGYNDTYNGYLDNLNLVWTECYRVLHPGCRLCINVGDQFARAAVYGRYKVIPLRSEIIRFCETIGFDYMGAVIWQKPTTMNTSGGGSVMGSYPYPRNGIIKIDYEFILNFKKPGTAPRPTHEAKELSRMTGEEWNLFFSGHWNIQGAKQRGHIAQFPLEVPYRLIRMHSFVGETVLDPFLGSGTTTAAAICCGRNSIGYEINEAFVTDIDASVRGQEVHGSNQVDIAVQESSKISGDRLSELTANLPYRSKARDLSPKKRKSNGFGSVIRRRQNAKGVTYNRVKQVVCATRIELDDGKLLDLEGVIVPPYKNEACISFIKEKTKGQRVYVEAEHNNTGDKDSIRGYLFLKNRTHINAHMIKAGLARAEKNRNYRFKKRFISYEK